MSTIENSDPDFLALKGFFARDVCQRATKPLRDNTEISVILDGKGPLTLAKRKGQMVVEPSGSAKPDMTFHLSKASLQRLSANGTDDIGEIGVAILQEMAHSNSSERMSAKVHIGLFDLLRGGYLGVLPLGGPTVMKFLASKGFNGIGKIKDAIASLRT